MSLAPVINALALPPDARVDQRVPKKLLLEQGAPTAADKRRIQDGIEEMIWIAALKPTNIGVPAFRDEVREYLEIAVLTATLRAAAKPTRLVELIHRAIPYPLVLVAAHGDTVSLSQGQDVRQETRGTVFFRVAWSHTSIISYKSPFSTFTSGPVTTNTISVSVVL